MKNQSTFAGLGFDGERALDYLVKTSEYGTLEQLVASLTLFSHPDTVKQTENRNLFPVVRRKAFAEIGKVFTLECGTVVMQDDNSAAIHAFCWSNAKPRFSNCQYNHVWSESQNPELYTSLANICVTPAFISKLTDTNKTIIQLLRHRAFELYEFWPTDDTREKPEQYDNLLWAATLPPVMSVEAEIRKKLKTLRSNRTLNCIKQIGWYFSKFQPDQMK